MTLLRNRPALSTQPRACVDGTDRIHDVSDSSRESHQCWREVGKWESFAAMMPAKFGDVMLSSQSLHHGLTASLKKLPGSVLLKRGAHISTRQDSQSTQRPPRPESRKTSWPMQH